MAVAQVIEIDVSPRSVGVGMVAFAGAEIEIIDCAVALENEGCNLPFCDIMVYYR